MVLDNASRSTDSYDGDAPLSNSDPFAGGPDSPGQDSKISIELSQLPQPMPLFGPMIGYTQAGLARHVSQFIGGIATAAGRSVTQDEAMVIAYHAAKMRRTQSYGDVLGVMAGAARAYQTKEVWKFPYRKPRENFNPEVLGPLRGTVARTFWQVLRFSSYALVGNLTLGFLVQTYALPVALVSIRTDPRLKSLNELVKKKEETRKGALQEGRRLPGPTPQQLPKSRDQDGSWQTDGDDVSPISGNEEWGGSYDQKQEAESYSKQVRAIASQRGQAEPQGQGQYQINARPQDSSSPSKPSSYDSDSPTGGYGGYEPVSTSNDSSSGSSWERLRRQASSGASPQQPSRQPQQRTSTRSSQADQRDGSVFDSFDLGSSDGKSMSKAEAQRQFDMKMERERNGGEFEDSGKRW